MVVRLELGGVGSGRFGSLGVSAMVSFDLGFGDGGFGFVRGSSCRSGYRGCQRRVVVVVATAGLGLGVSQWWWTGGWLGWLFNHF